MSVRSGRVTLHEVRFQRDHMSRAMTEYQPVPVEGFVYVNGDELAVTPKTVWATSAHVR